MAQTNYRTINIDALDLDSPANFDLSTLTPSVKPISTEEVQTNVNQIRQILRSGDSEGALRSALEAAPYGADARGKDLHTALLTEILQSIRASEMTPLLQRFHDAPGGTETLDVLMKYLYKGMSASHTAATSSTPSPGKPNMTPQSTGFSQIGGRNIGSGTESSGQAMSVLLSWHEKVVEIAGAGSVVRVMTDRRTV